jgi:hypothetical protein
MKKITKISLRSFACLAFVLPLAVYADNTMGGASSDMMASTNQMNSMDNTNPPQMGNMAPNSMGMTNQMNSMAPNNMNGGAPQMGGMAPNMMAPTNQMNSMAPNNMDNTNPPQMMSPGANSMMTTNQP